ncbi:peptide ABC transporter substrate-binding protein [uncultured Tateyamaria sp.]|uniref:peptide ABC transporter substrate-binding protein n=1 Tax=uncultured Tateyamaria sp. TaxID=455651 RepID=UPI0026294AE3|nr:peptide ABC transporter substrate-binding protein [uncultured Tateyamaria sp.]
MTRFDRRALFATGAAAALLAATGASATPKQGGRLRAALSDALFDRAVAATVFDNLTEIAADGTLRGELATEWVSDASAQRWEFALREDVSFHDGAVFDASTVTLPMQVDIIDRHRIAITLDVPNPNLPYLLAQPGFEVQGVTGTGLYAVQKLDAGRHFIGRRAGQHWKQDAGWFDTVEFVRLGTDNIRAEALRDGLVDVADIVALDAYADPKDYVTLPGSDVTTHIANRALGIPLTIGTAWPLDNLRMAERWWMV